MTYAGRIRVKRGHISVEIHDNEIRYLCDAADFVTKLATAVYAGEVELPEWALRQLANIGK